jgi:hypothetical protein
VSAKLVPPIPPPPRGFALQKPRRRWGFFFVLRTGLSTDPRRFVGSGGASHRGRGRPPLAGPHVPVDEPLGVFSQIVVGVEGSFDHLARDVFGDVARPALGGVEGDDAESVRILAGQEIADDRLAIGLGATRSWMTGASSSLELVQRCSVAPSRHR